MLKCTEFDFGWDSTPDPLGELNNVPPDLAEFKGPSSNGREARAREGQRGGQTRRGEWRRGQEDFRALPQFQIWHYTTEEVNSRGEEMSSENNDF